MPASSSMRCERQLASPVVAEVVAEVVMLVVVAGNVRGAPQLASRGARQLHSEATPDTTATEKLH